MAEVVRYVDPDASGAGDGTSWTDAYTSLSAWDSGEGTDLVTDGDWHHCYVRSSSGTADTTNVLIYGWTTGTDNYILIEAADGDEAVKTGWDATRYRLSVANDDCMDIAEEYVRVKGLQIEVSSTNTDNQDGIDVWFQSGAGDIRISDCYIKGAGNNDYTGAPIRVDDAQAEVTIENCILFLSSTKVSTGNSGVYIANCNTVDIYHTVTYGGWGGVARSNGTVTVTNSAAFNHTDDFNGTITIDHCASDDGDGTNSVSPDGSDWDNEFSDPANGDFTLKNSGNLYQGGTTITGGPDKDIDGDDWDSSSPSIGVDEYVAAGGTTYDVSTGDGVSLSDSSGGVLTVAASTSDGISLSDTPSAVLTITTTATDGASLGDSGSGSLSIPASVSDGMSLGDSDSGTMTLAASAVDGITLSDAISAGFTFGVDTSDGITLSDSSTTGGTIEVTAADGITLSDSSSAVRDILATVADGITLSDASSSTATISAEVADGVSFSDTVSAALSILASVSDGITLSDIAIDATFLPVGRVRITVSSAQASVTITTKQAGIDVTAKQADVSVSVN